MQKLVLPVVLTEGEDGFIVAEIPIIPGCVTQGQTKEEALRNVQEAALLCLEGRKEEGWEIPRLVGVEQIKVTV